MKKVSTGTIVRTVVLTLALVNQSLQMTGHSVIPINDEDVSNLITIIFTISSAIAAWWKNNSFTQNAIRADELLSDMKEVDKNYGK